MSLLHDTMNGVFNAIFGPIYDDGYLKRAVYTLNQELRDRYPNGEPVKIQKDSCTEAQRGQAVSAKDRRCPLSGVLRRPTRVADLEASVAVLRAAVC